VDLRDHGSTFTDGRSYTLGRARTYITNGKDAGAIGL
jgi:hypothetical protein